MYIMEYFLKNKLTRFSNIVCAEYHKVCIHFLSVKSSHVLYRCCKWWSGASPPQSTKLRRRRSFDVLAPVTLMYPPRRDGEFYEQKTQSSHNKHCMTVGLKGIKGLYVSNPHFIAIHCWKWLWILYLLSLFTWIVQTFNLFLGHKVVWVGYCLRVRK